LGLLLCSSANAQILFQDGSANTITQNNFPTSITNRFTVTSGASVLVVLTYVQNNIGSNQPPSLSNWGSQSFTHAGGEYCGRSVYSSSDVFYIMNPATGTHNIIATNAGPGTVTAMAIQAYTLNGVNTSAAPVFFHTNQQYGTNLSVNLTGVPAGAWAAFSFTWGFNGSGNYVTTTSGTLGYAQGLNNLTNFIGQDVLMGGVANLSAGSTTITIWEAGASGVQSGMAAAVFAAAPYTPVTTNVVATGQVNQVALTWNDASGGAATNYIVLRSTVSGSGYTAIRTNTSNSSTTFTDTNVVNYTTYYYVVEAVGPNGTSSYSSMVSTNAVGVPVAPTGLTATALNGQVGLVWQPQPDATSYHVLRATGSPTGFTVIASPATASFTDSGLANGMTYYYAVNAVTTYGSSSNSAYVSALPGAGAASISLHDGSLSSTQKVSNASTISTNFVVTQGASVLVVELWDYNNKTDNSSPHSMTWSNTALGSIQTLTRAISQNCQGYNYSDSDIFYLFNPSPGYGVVSGTDPNSTAPTTMIMQVYTLSGVDTNVVPASYDAGNGSTTSLSVVTAPATASGSWAAVISYNANTGHPLTNSTTSGTSYYFNNSIVNAMGYIANLIGGSTTITAQEDFTGGATLMALAATVFAPVVGTPAPTNLVATAQANQVGLSWSDASGGAATNYVVLRSGTSGSGYTPIATNNGNASVTYTDSNVTAGGTYYYVVQAVAPAGAGAYSTQVSAYLGVLSAPTGLTAAAGNGAVALSWNALPGATYYNVLRATSNPGSQGSYSIISSSSAADYTDNGLVNGTTYYYEVNAVNGFGTSAPAAYVSAAPGAAVGQPPLTEIRTASPTVLVAFFKDSRWTGQVWQRFYNTNQVDTSNLSLWTLNGTPVSAIDAFITEANAVDYHIYLHVPPLVNGATYTLVTPNGSASFVFDDTKILCESIKVNQSGYSALSHTRYANLAIWLGSGGAQPLSGPLPTYTVFNQFTGQHVASGTVQAYGGGVQDSSSGDYVYRIDLSVVPEGGPYRVSVSGYGCSYPFGVGGDFSRRLGYVAFRALFYNRCAGPLVQPYAWANIRPYPCHTNVYDSEGSNSSDTFSSGTVQTSQPKLFVHGGYHDAGDADKRGYHLLIPPVLMTTYEAFPNLFTDKQFNIPDKFDANYNALGSGNGVPDILDEAMWGTMVWTNIQSTPREPSGAVAWGINAAGYPAWYINFDQDTLLWGTETNNVDSCSVAAGVFMHMARLIKPYSAQISADLQARGDAAYNYASSTWPSSMKNTHKLYFAIQKYLLTGDTTANNNIHSLYTQTSAFPGSYHKQTGGFLTDGSIWMASYFMSYILATNNPPYALDSTVVNYFCNQLRSAADTQVSWTTNAAYPSGWRATDDPTSYNFSQYFFTAEGQFAYPCLMQWALTHQQQYIDTVSLLMDYTQGLNPLGKCYMTGMGFEQTHNPQQQESAYAEWTMGWGGPIPGITVYGPGPVMTGPNLLQVPDVSRLARERKWMDDCGSYEWNEFTVEESEMFPAVVYPVLAQGGAWSPAKEPFLNPAASIQWVGNGFTLTFGGLPGQTNYVQVSSSANGPWSDLSGPLFPDASGQVHFTDTTTPAPAARFYRARWTAPIY
jgi:endoglucanase